MEGQKGYIDIKLFASWLLIHFNREGNPISPLKLQKILYYCQAWCYTLYNDPIFQDEPEAWTMGPVYRVVYDEYKEKYYRYQEIELNIPENEIDKVFNEQINKLNIASDKMELIAEVLVKYGSLDDSRLVLRTHNEDPWRETRKLCTPFELCAKPIPHNAMKKYYSYLINKDVVSAVEA